MNRLRLLEELVSSDKDTKVLSNVEVRSILKGTMDPVLILYLFYILKEELLDPNVLLVQAIAMALDEEYLIPIGMAIRFGADPNLYVNTSGVGALHILAYTYYRLPNKALINYIVLMLLASESNASMAAMDDTGGTYTMGRNPPPGPTVLEWISMKGYQTVIPDIQAGGLAKVERPFLTSIGEYIDRPDLITTEVSTVSIIRYHSYRVLSKLDSRGLDLQENLNLSLKYLNLTAFELFLEEGAVVTYLRMNDLLIRGKMYGKEKLTVPLDQIANMLKEGIKRNVEMDREQYTILNSISSGIAKEALDTYREPKWKKQCAVSKVPINEDLKALAMSLGISVDDKAQVCKEIAKVQVLDPKSITNAAISRQRQRVSNDMSTVSDFISKDPDLSSHVCTNKTLFEDDPYTYTDLDLAYYRDNLGITWCFVSDMYDDIISSGINPYTDEKIPQYFIESLQMKKDEISKLPEKRPTNVSDGLTYLSKDDNITNDKSMEYLDFIYSNSTKYNVNRYAIDSLTPAQIENVLSYAGADADTRDLTVLHARFTLARVIAGSMKEDTDPARRAMNRIRDIFRSKITRKS